MSPASFVAHRIAQLSLMKLTVAFKFTDAAAKPENDGVRLNEYQFNVRGVECFRTECTCRVSFKSTAESDPLKGGGGVES